MGNELIITGTTQESSDPVEYTLKNINPAVPVATLRQTAIDFNNLTTLSLLKIIYRQDIDITTAN